MPGPYSYTTGSSTLVWDAWTSTNCPTCTTTGTNATFVWNSWTQTTGGPMYVQPQFSEAELRAEEERRWRQEQERQVRLARTRAEFEAASDRARELLHLILSEEQWRSFEEHREFFVVGSSGRRYKVQHGTQGNLKLVVGDQVVESLCVHPPLAEEDEEHHWRNIPTEDVLVAQVLALRHDEEGLRRTANITRVHHRQDAA